MRVLFSVLFFSFFYLISYAQHSKDVVLLKDTMLPLNQREAILILPGVGDSKRGRKHQIEFFGSTQYDLYIPDYLSRNTVEDCIENLSDFIDEYKLKSYKKLHVFSYILGSWVLNSYLNDNEIPNLASVVYDRSPLQERAPQIVVDKIGLIGKIMFGNLIKDLTLHPYIPFCDSTVHIGLVIESTATNIVKLYKKTALGYGEIDWYNLEFNQPFDDLFFTRLNHKQMYHHLDEVGNEIIYFFKFGVFPIHVQRSFFGWNPFKRRKARKIYKKLISE